MRAARIHEYQDTVDDALQIDEVPEPGIERSTDIIVDIAGAGWCQTDNHVIEGDWDEHYNPTLPLTLGHENAGTVVEVGDEVETVEVGDEVICQPMAVCGKCRPCRTGTDNLCENVEAPGFSMDGGFADYMRTSELAAVTLDSADPVEVAPHADAGITGYHAAKRAVRELNPGDHVAVVGVGGLGHIGLQVVDAMSATTITAIDPKEGARDLARDLDADHVLDPTDHDVPAELDGITDGEGVAQILDYVGHDDTAEWGPAIVKRGGDHHVAGYGGHVHTPTQALVGTEMNYRGTLTGTHADLQELIALIEMGEVEIHTTKFDLDEVNEVARRVEDGDVLGRAVIVP